MDFTILHFAIHIVWRANVICTCRKSGIARKTTVAYPELRLIELTVTDKEQGFVGFRHLKNGKCYYNYTNQDSPNEYLYRDILSDYGFDTEKNIGNNVWLARKAFKEYGFDEQDVTRNILEELKNLRNRFNHMKIVGNNNNHMNK